jgi:DNA-binding transcriptional MerR regulator
MSKRNQQKPSCRPEHYELYFQAKNLRLRGHTQEQVAEQLGIGQNTLRYWERTDNWAKEREVMLSGKQARLYRYTQLQDQYISKAERAAEKEHANNEDKTLADVIRKYEDLINDVSPALELYHLQTYLERFAKYMARRAHEGELSGEFVQQAREVLDGFHEEQVGLLDQGKSEEDNG